VCVVVFFLTEDLNSSNSLAIDLGDQGFNQGPAQGSAQVPVTTELTVQASALKLVVEKDISELRAKQILEPMPQQPAPSVNDGVFTGPPGEEAADLPVERPVEQQLSVVSSVSAVAVRQGSSRLARLFWVREAVGLVQLSEPFPSVYLEEGYRGIRLVFLRSYVAGPAT